jgi:hypothetical protein
VTKLGEDVLQETERDVLRLGDRVAFTGPFLAAAASSSAALTA